MIDVHYRPLVASALTAPEVTTGLTLQQWDLLIRQARSAGVLARLGYLLDRRHLLNDVPLPALKHIKSAQIYAKQHAASLDWEVRCIKKALANLSVPVVFLKGAAYALAKDEASIGRVFTDIDILVPGEQLAEVEKALVFEGWKTAYLSDYDQMYYRKWMHEIPPMQHLHRRTTIDVHHNILPTTSQFCPNPKYLLADIAYIADRDVWVLAPTDRVLHSATHLFHEGEFEHGFRDLSDLDLLLRQFSTDHSFWNNLLERAEILEQKLPLYYALRYTAKIFQTSIPSSVLNVIEKYHYKGVRERLMDFLFLHALMPNHSSCEDRWTGLARWLLYIRSHYLRMPLRLLIPHLSRKAWLRLAGKEQH